MKLRWIYKGDSHTPTLQYRGGEGEDWVDVELENNPGPKEEVKDGAGPEAGPGMIGVFMMDLGGEEGPSKDDEIRILRTLNDRLTESRKEDLVTLKLRDAKIEQLEADNRALQGQLKEAETISLGRARETTRLRDSLRRLTREAGEVLRGRYAPDEG